MHRIGVGVVVAGLWLASPAWAASVGVPAASQEHRLEVTAEYSRLFDRTLESAANETDDLSAGSQAHLRANWLLFPWLQPYVKLGAAEYQQRQLNTNIAGLGRRNVTFDYDWGFSWGGGLQGIYEFPWAPGWFLGYDGQYLRSDNDLGAVRHSGQRGSNVKGNISVQEWHAAFYGGKTFSIGESTLTAYAGGRWSTLRLDIDSTLTYDISEGTVTVTGNTDADDHAGAFVGVAYQTPGRWRLGVEGRFIDETAVTVQAGYTF